MTEPAAAPSATTRPDRPPLIDIGLALGMAFVLLPMPVLYGGYGGFDSNVVLALTTLLGAAQIGALAWRRSHPGASALVVGVAAVAHLLLGQVLQPSDVAVLVAVYSLTAFGRGHAPRMAVLAAMAGSLLQGVGWTFLGFTLSSGLVVGLFVATGCAGLSLACWALGLVRRARFQQQESLAERAARLERERDQQAQIATQAERTRIAREMHDIVAHSLSVMIAQADGGRYAAAGDPAATTRALTTVGETGRAALADMRRILGVLRADGGAADLVPQPADTDLTQLVASMKDTLSVSLVQMGQPRAMPPGTGATVYRIAQEALTNILKHAGPSARATLMVQWTPHHLVLQVHDDGRGAAAAAGSDGGGHGILGMRERATMLGGTLTAGPRPGGGFGVRAEIPVPSSGARPTVTAPEPPTAPVPTAPPPSPTTPPSPPPVSDLVPTLPAIRPLDQRPR